LDLVTDLEYFSTPDDHLLQNVKQGGVTLAAFTYDSKERIRTYTDQSTGITLTYDYNDLNDVTKITYPDGKYVSIAYSTVFPHRVTGVRDRTGKTISYEYNAMGDLVKIIDPDNINVGGWTVRYDYDPNRNVSKITDVEYHETSFEYDLDNTLSKKTYADGKFETFTHEDGGFLRRLRTWTNARGVTATYTYDGNNQPVLIEYSDTTPDVELVYDDYHRLAELSAGTETYLYDYYANSWARSVDGPWDNDTITYYYDAIGRWESVVRQGGQTVDYVYDDPPGRLSQIAVGAGVYTYGYSAANPADDIVKTLTRPNGAVTTYGYDALARLTDQFNQTSALATINRHEYGYDSVNELRSRETVTNGPVITGFLEANTGYTHNNVNQLVSTDNPNRNYSYDDDGNMITGYTPDGYQFTATYDAANRLTAVEYTDSAMVVHRTEYEYHGGAFVDRIVKYEDAAVVSDVRIVYDGYLPAQERDENNNVIREYTWGLSHGGGIGGLLEVRQGGQTYQYLYDGKGNVAALADGSENVVAAYAYSPFGELLAGGGSVNQPFGFSTKRYDPQTGLSYYGYRFYSPELGRWLNRDPLGEAGGINLYGFVGNSPIDWIDFYGRSPRGTDKRYDLPRKFWRWAHRRVKGKRKENFSREEVKELFDEWEDLGRPGPDSKGKYRKGSFQWSTPLNHAERCPDDFEKLMEELTKGKRR